MELGQRISSHRGTFAAGGQSWYLAAVALLAGVLWLVKAAGSADLQQALIGVAGLGIGAVLLIMPLTRWKQSVEVFERGFVWTRLYGVVRVTTDEIREVTMTTYRSKQGSRTEVKVELANGKSYAITGVEQPEQLTDMLRAASRGGAPGPTPSAAGPGFAPAQAGQGWAPGGWKPPGS